MDIVSIIINHEVFIRKINATYIFEYNLNLHSIYKSPYKIITKLQIYVIYMYSYMQQNIIYNIYTYTIKNIYSRVIIIQKINIVKKQRD